MERPEVTCRVAVNGDSQAVRTHQYILLEGGKGTVVVKFVASVICLGAGGKDFYDEAWVMHHLSLTEVTFIATD